MFNLHTKHVIVESTARTIYNRFSSHLRGNFDKISKKAANYIIKRDIENWIIMPLETGIVKTKLKDRKGHWTRIFGHLLVN